MIMILFNNKNIGIILAIVTKDYLAQSTEELSLQKNRIVTILNRDIGEGWWQGDLNGKTGIFPADVSIFFLVVLYFINWLYLARGTCTRK